MSRYGGVAGGHAMRQTIQEANTYCMILQYVQRFQEGCMQSDGCAHRCMHVRNRQYAEMQGHSGTGVK